MKIYDCFPFFNELDILEIRLNELYDVVDYFVLVESRCSFSNNPKLLFYEENKDRFLKFSDKIIHIILDKFEDDSSTLREDKLHHNWTREEEQRRLIIKGLIDAQPEDIVCVSDVDEIINHKLIEQIKRQGIPEATIVQLVLIFYKGKLNCLNKDNRDWCRKSEASLLDLLKPLNLEYKARPWQAPGICTVNTLHQFCQSNPHLIRAYAKPLKRIPNNIKITGVTNIINGWHFCSMVDVLYKMRNFSHSNEMEKYNDEKLLEWVKKQQIDESIFIDISNAYVDMYPQYIIDNKNKFDQLGWTIER